jgi:energy-coupling factor transporter ATP-binding protein EcfA2
MPGSSGGRRWPSVVALVAVLVLVGGGGWLVLVWVTAVDGARAADPQASVFGVLLASAIAAAGALAWARQRGRQASLPATAEQVDLAAATLAGLVTEQWQEEANARALGDPEPMPVRWRLTSPVLMDHPAVITRGGGDPVFAGRSDRIGELVDQFRALARHRLVITGPAGCGKTTLAVQLLLALLPPPGQPPDGPVPVLLSLVGWSPDLQPRVQDWLIERLDQTYPALRAIASDSAAALVNQGRVLPVLDGLDEVAPEQRAGIITALNATLHGDAGVILTSRRAEYRSAVTDAGDVLTGAAAVAPLALTGREAAAFLRTHLPPDHDRAWDGVLNALERRRAAPLAAVTASPLGLWLVRTVYVDDRRLPGRLVDGSYPDVAALRAHLLDELIPAVVRSRPPLARRRRDAPDVPLRPSRQHMPGDLRRWLTTVAEQLAATARRPRISDWAWWELVAHTFPTRRSTLALRVLAGLVSAMAFGFAFGLAFGPVVGLVAGVTGGLAVRWYPLVENPEHANLRLGTRIPEIFRQVISQLAGWLVRGLLVGLVGGLFIGLLWAGLVRGLVGGLAFGLAFGLMLAVAGALTSAIGSSDIAERSASPTGSYRGDLTYSASNGLVGGSAFGLLLGVAIGLSVGPAFGLLAGTAIGLMIALVRIGVGASSVFVVAVLQQAARRRLPMPWRVMAVLEDCHRLGLLRTIGPVYQFRHAELQDHLAPPAER